MEETCRWKMNNVDPEIHKLYRWAYLKEKGTYKGVYDNWLIDDLDYLEGRLLRYFISRDDEKIQAFDGFRAIHTQFLEFPYVDILDNDPKKDYTCLMIGKLPYKLLNKIHDFQREVLGSKMGTKGRVCNLAMYIGLLNRFDFKMFWDLEKEVYMCKNFVKNVESCVIEYAGGF